LLRSRLPHPELRPRADARDPDRDDTLAIVGAFHDLEAFGSLDHLAPSIRAQDEWLRATGREGGARNSPSWSPSTTAQRPLDPMPHMRARRALDRAGHTGATG
jgi:hypothetical protein